MYVVSMLILRGSCASPSEAQVHLIPAFLYIPLCLPRLTVQSGQFLEPCKDVAVVLCGAGFIDAALTMLGFVQGLVCIIY